MTANGGTINFLVISDNINLTMGEYILNTPKISIPMGGVYVVLGVSRWQSLGVVALNFQEFFMNLSLEGKHYELGPITGKSSMVISSNDKKTLLINEHEVIIEVLVMLQLTI